MGKIRTIELTARQQLELEQGYTNSKSSTFSRRCHILLLKSQGRTSTEVGSIVKMNHISVNNWLTRYESEGIEGLKTRPGRGRKQILDHQKDVEKVRQAVKKERQRLSQARQVLEQELDKEFSTRTLKRFLKNISADGNEFD
jgi:transposase